MIEHGRSEHHGVFISPPRGIAPLQMYHVPVVLVGHIADKSVREGCPGCETKLGLKREERFPVVGRNL